MQDNCMDQKVLPGKHNDFTGSQSWKKPVSVSSAFLCSRQWGTQAQPSHHEGCSLPFLTHVSMDEHRQKRRLMCTVCLCAGMPCYVQQCMGWPLSSRCLKDIWEQFCCSLISALIRITVQSHHYFLFISCWYIMHLNKSYPFPFFFLIKENQEFISPINITKAKGIWLMHAI